MPRTKKEVRASLGLTGYYRKFIPNYAGIARLLTALLKKNESRGVAIEWSEECAASFRKLKEALVNPPVLRSPNFDLDFIVQTDASVFAIGAVLPQKYDDEEHLLLISDGNYHLAN